MLLIFRITLHNMLRNSVESLRIYARNAGRSRLQWTAMIGRGSNIHSESYKPVVSLSFFPDLFNPNDVKYISQQ